MKKAIALLAGLILTAGLASAAGVTLKLKGGLFMPTDPDFKTIYGSGPQFGIELEFDLGRGIGVYLGGDYFARSGKMIFSEETTDLRLIPIGAGIIYKHMLGEMAGVSVGGGLHYVLFHENNVLGPVDAGGVGFEAKAEAFLNFAAKIGGLVYVKFSSCSMTPVDLTFNAGGLEFGAGLAFRI